MKKKNNQKGLLLLCLIILQSSCFANFNDTLLREKNVVEFWLPKDSVNYQRTASNEKNRLGLLFEQEFNDDVQIYVDDSLVFSKWLKTIPSLSAVNENIDLKYNDTSSMIRIVLKNIGAQTIFRPVPGYRICYINRMYGIWNLEFSNFYRDYH